MKSFLKGSRRLKKVIPHNEFIDRIKKSLYFGADAVDDADDVISRPLAEYSAEIFSEAHKNHSLHRLNSIAAGIVHAPPCSLIMALIYLDRINVTDPGYARQITPQELFIVSMMISTKFYAGYDEQVYISDWAEDGNISEERLKQIELEFLCAIDWNIYISNEQFFNKLTNVERILARREGIRRGWLTYTELIQMLPPFTLAKFLLNNFTVMMVSYAASVITIAGAFFMVSQIPGNALHRKTPIVNDQSSIYNAASMEMNDITVNKTNSPLATEEIASLTRFDPEENNCSAALNVEDELIKLEKQYCKEAKLEELRGRNNEIPSDSRLNLPETAVQKSDGKIGYGEKFSSVTNIGENKWLSLKKGYSKEKEKEQHQQQHFADMEECLKTFTNCTTMTFWNLLTMAADFSQQALMQQPYIWLKLM